MYRSSSKDITTVSLSILGGALIAVCLAAMLSSARPLTILIVFVGLMAVLPSFIIKDSKLYWLSLYLLLFPLEGGKRISNLDQSSEDLLDTIGLPPTGDLGVKLYPSDFALLALTGPWLFELVRNRGKGMYFPRVSYLFLAYIAWELVGTVLKARYSSLSCAQLVQDFKYFLVYIYAVNNLNRQTVKSVLNVLLVILFCEASAALFLHVLGYTRESIFELLHLQVAREYEFLIGQEHEDFRAAGTMASASNLAMYLQLLFPIPLALLCITKNVQIKACSFVIYILAAGAMYATGSRAGLLGLVAGSITCLVILFVRRYISVRELALLTLVAGFGAILTAGPNSLLYNFMTARPENYENRFALMEQGRDLILANPILGVGPNNSTAVRLGTDQNSEGSYYELFPIHNAYIVLAAEAGVIGFLLFFSGLASVVLKAIRLSKSEQADNATVCIVVVSAYVALWTQLGGDHFVGNAQHSLLWLYAGIIVGISSERKLC